MLVSAQLTTEMDKGSGFQGPLHRAVRQKFPAGSWNSFSHTEANLFSLKNTHWEYVNSSWTGRKFWVDWSVEQQLKTTVPV